MQQDTTTIGLLLACISTLAGVIAFLVKQILMMSGKTIEVVDKNTKAFVEMTSALHGLSDTNKEMVGMVRDHLIPSKK